jgi:activator of 2-hydroxyglutaryl-CoA dehydratase
MITAGIDMGSRSIKVILLEELKVDGAPQLKYGVKKASHHDAGRPGSGRRGRQGLR